MVGGGRPVVSALGIVLGRLARLNSWDTVTEPVGTAERIFVTLSWRGAPVAFVAILVAVWATHLVVRTMAVACSRSAARVLHLAAGGRAVVA